MFKFINFDEIKVSSVVRVCQDVVPGNVGDRLLGDLSVIEAVLQPLRNVLEAKVLSHIHILEGHPLRVLQLDSLEKVG